MCFYPSRLSGRNFPRTAESDFSKLIFLRCRVKYILYQYPERVYYIKNSIFINYVLFVWINQWYQTNVIKEYHTCIGVSLSNRIGYKESSFTVRRTF